MDIINGKVYPPEDVVKVERLKEIMMMASKFKWIYPANKTSYPLMQLSEVEKCCLAMIDDNELERMRQWLKELNEGKWTPFQEGESKCSR